ncbi:unnamed protein product [Medioppia subpectinata]|uniref:UBA domain-containing protein n=1 Tax=Medioppia subpectinata TaxID=1979941 RepID=A0A7R9KIR2_9ACAR|nr:unnamed protein product [Medioppia subpectinata]CAG2103083.1 unnamed protein product [Medioppia subpectinata]
MGLHGGGEESLTSGSSGWGTLPPMNSSSAEWGSGSANHTSSANHWPNSSRQMANCDQTLSTSPKPSSSWAQAAGKGLNNGPIGPNHDLSVFGNNDNSTKRQTNSDFQQINSEIKDTALVSDNWGITVINQDSPWKLPPSPQSSPREVSSSASQWKSSTSSGTEIWENTVRHKTKGPTPTPTAQSSSGQSWGPHTPSTHIGGTWGEDEDNTNHWTGVPQHNQHNPATNQSNTSSSSSWSANASIANNNTMNNSSNNNNINNNNNNGNNNNPTNNMQWNHNSDNSKHNNSENNSSRHNSEGRHNAENRPKMNHNSQWADYNNEQNDSNGSEPQWNDAKSGGESFGTWAPESTHKKDGSGWDKDSAEGRGGSYDDGTAVWGNPVRQGKVSHWKAEAAAAAAAAAAKPITQTVLNPNGNTTSSGMSAMIPSSPGMIRLPAGAPIAGKNNGENWGKPSPPIPSSRGNSWSEASTHRDSPANSTTGSLWCDSDAKPTMNRTPNTPNWAESSNSSPLAYWAAKPKATNNQNNQNSNWSDGQIDTSSWGGPKQGKPLSRDIIWASKQFRILTDMGFKKDDVENALRNSSMKLEEAINELKNSSPRDSNAMDLENMQRFKGSGMGSSNTPSLLSNTSGIANSSLSSISRNPLGSILPPPHQPTAQTQSFTQANQVQSALGSNPNGSRIGGSAQSNQSNTANLRLLVQQIQLAVHAGHLNAQILNQPLAPPTLQLLYQLLQQIKFLQQLQVSANQHSKTGATNPGGVPALQSSINVQLTQTKQRILNLQNQIAAQQAIFLKEQHQSQQIVPQTPNAMMGTGSNANTSTMHSQQTSNNDFFKSPQPDNSLVINNDRDIGSQSLSRFQTTWKPAFNKEDNKVNVNNMIPNEFSRAPGPLPKQSLSRSDVPNWTGFGQNDESSGWPSDVTVNSMSGLNLKHNDLKDMPNALSGGLPDAYNALNDMVPEFEPGKPWKGNSSLKSIEDDPTITPGSVNRSPLSINTIKDPLFNWPSKLSPGTPNTNAADSLLSLSSSTWAFTPPSNPHINYNTVDNNKPKNNLKSPSNWGALNAELQLNACTDGLWSGGSVSKTSRPPPGLTPQIKSPATTLPNSGTVNPTVSSAHNLWNPDNRQNGSEFLLLRNLTPQIDGSTLKTLCLQHGPLQLFHLFLNHGIALTRYSTREEATKAQSALNNCVLGNTSILADIPQEAEVQQYLQLISGGGQQIASNSLNNPLNWSQNGQNSSSSNGVNQSSGLYRNANSSLQFAGTSNSTPSKMDSSTTSPGWNTSGMSLWPFSNSGNNLWSAPSGAALNAQDRSTPSSIQSLLPGDLLGGETN